MNRRTRRTGPVLAAGSPQLRARHSSVFGRKALAWSTRANRWAVDRRQFGQRPAHTFESRAAATAHRRALRPTRLLPSRSGRARRVPVRPARISRVKTAREPESPLMWSRAAEADIRSSTVGGTRRTALRRGSCTASPGRPDRCWTCWDPPEGRRRPGDRSRLPPGPGQAEGGAGKAGIGRRHQVVARQPPRRHRR